MSKKWAEELLKLARAVVRSTSAIRPQYVRSPSVSAVLPLFYMRLLPNQYIYIPRDIMQKVILHLNVKSDLKNINNFLRYSKKRSFWVSLHSSYLCRQTTIQ